MKTKVPKSDEKLQKKIVTDSWNTYILEASIWTPEAKSEWAITKIDATWNVKFPLWTNWVPAYSFRFLPADVLTLTYSYEADIIPIQSITILSSWPTLQWTLYTLLFEANEDVNSNIIWQTKTTTKGWNFIITSVNQKQFTVDYTSPAWLSWPPTQRKDTLTFDLFDLYNNNSTLSYLTPTLN